MAIIKYFAASTETSPYTWNTRRKKLKTFFQYLVNESILTWGQNVPLFCTEDGDIVTLRTWQRRLVKYAAEIGAKVTPYQLRHTFATMFLRYGGNPFALQQNRGHLTMSMTQRYVDLVVWDIREQHEQATPLNSLVTVRHRVRRKLNK